MAKAIADYFDEEAAVHDEQFIRQMEMKPFYDAVEQVLNQCRPCSNVLVLGCGMFAVRSGLLPLAGGGKSEATMDKVAMQECAPEAPAEEACDCAESIILPEEENRLMPTIGTPHI